ncbi:MAG: hypothetical protein U0T07_09550 [Chitinophagales bacterium]
MKYTIYFVVTLMLFTACKQNATTETITETHVTTDSTMTAVQAIEQPAEAPKSDLPFIGKRMFNFLGGIVTGIYIEIKSDGTVLLSSESVNFDKNDNPDGYKEDVYFKKKYSDITRTTPNGIIINVSQDKNEEFYKIEKDMIYMVDKNGVKYKDCGDEQNEICGTPLEKI